MYASEPPSEVEDLLGVELEWDERPAVVESWECWEDADEDGRYGGVDLILRFTDERGGEENVRPDVLQDVLAGREKPSSGEHLGKLAKSGAWPWSSDVPISAADFETPRTNDDEEDPF
jgi:hypothetical protein